MGSSLSCEYESRGWKTFQIFRTFILVNIGWLFDACATATTAFYAMRAVFINFKISILTDGSLYKLGLVKRDWTILIVATIILFISSVMKEKGMSLLRFRGGTSACCALGSLSDIDICNSTVWLCKQFNGIYVCTVLEMI